MTDASGNNGHHKGLHLRGTPGRVVSLVPSLTETMFELGLGNRVVGVTDFCTEPAGQLDPLPRVGGPRDARFDDILALRPDIVLASRDENSRELVEALSEAGVPVWITFPTSVTQTLDMLWELVRIFQVEPARAKVDVLERAVEWARAAGADQPRVRYFCPIWQDQLDDGTPWWMTFNQETYLSDVLELAGGENVFSARMRRYPLEADLGRAEEDDAGERDTRYPRVTLEEIRAADPDLILLPSEPYSFSNRDQARIVELLNDTRAVRSGRVRTLDGSLISWYGTRLGRAITELPGILAF